MRFNRKHTVLFGILITAACKPVIESQLNSETTPQTAGGEPKNADVDLSTLVKKLKAPIEAKSVTEASLLSKTPGAAAPTAPQSPASPTNPTSMSPDASSSTTPSPSSEPAAPVSPESTSSFELTGDLPSAIPEEIELQSGERITKQELITQMAELAPFFASYGEDISRLDDGREPREEMKVKPNGKPLEVEQVADPAFDYTQMINEQKRLAGAPPAGSGGADPNADFSLTETPALSLAEDEYGSDRRQVFGNCRTFCVTLAAGAKAKVNSGLGFEKSAQAGIRVMGIGSEEAVTVKLDGSRKRDGGRREVESNFEIKLAGFKIHEEKIDAAQGRPGRTSRLQKLRRSLDGTFRFFAGPVPVSIAWEIGLEVGPNLNISFNDEPRPLLRVSFEPSAGAVFTASAAAGVRRVLSVGIEGELNVMTLTLAARSAMASGGGAEACYSMDVAAIHRMLNGSVTVFFENLINTVGSWLGLTPRRIDHELFEFSTAENRMPIFNGRAGTCAPLPGRITSSGEKAYVFLGDQYVLYDKKEDSQIEGYPRSISGGWTGIPGRIDDAVNWGTGAVYFFVGDKYYRFNKSSDSVPSSYPRAIARGFTGVPFSTIDAAVNWGNGKVYLFSGNRYVRFDIERDSADEGYPKEVNNTTWPGLGWTSIDAAVNWGNGYAYFFKGNEYVKYNVSADRAEPGYPRYIRTGWPTLTFADRIDAIIDYVP